MSSPASKASVGDLLKTDQNTCAPRIPKKIYYSAFTVGFYNERTQAIKSNVAVAMHLSRLSQNQTKECGPVNFVQSCSLETYEKIKSLITKELKTISTLVHASSWSIFNTWIHIGHSCCEWTLGTTVQRYENHQGIST